MKIAITIGAVLVVIILLFLFPIVKVEGDSMLPTFHEGELLIGCKIFHRKHCKAGDIYVIHLKDDENGEPYFIIKRLEGVYKNNLTGEIGYFFLGDNREVSADSRHYGLFKSNDVIVKIIGKKGKRKYEYPKN